MTNIERIRKIISEELRIDKDKIVPEAHVFDDLNFDSLDDAILWCQKNSYQYRVIDQTYKPVKPKSYASNFSNNRKTSWTH